MKYTWWLSKQELMLRKEEGWIMLPRLQKHITTDGAEMRYAPAMYCTPRPSDHKHIYVTHCYTWEVLACVGNQVPSFNYNGKYNHVLTSQLYTLDKGAMTGLVVFDLIWLECNRKGMIIKQTPESIYLSKRVKACVTIGFVCTIYMQVSRCAYGYVHMFHHHYIGAVTK